MLESYSEELMEQIVLSVFIGLGLSVACGFRIFVPLLVMSIAGHLDVVPLSESFEWIGTLPSMLAFFVATIVEILAYYIPWLDNILDTIGLPTATLAGVVVMASAMADLPPLLVWSTAIIAGGGGALTVKGMGTVVRAGSSITTGGLANPIVSTGENIASIILSIMAIVLPILAALLTMLILVLAIRKIIKWKRKRKNDS